MKNLSEKNKPEIVNKENDSVKKEKRDKNKLIGPGLGLVILGLVYFIWYIMPFAFEYLAQKPVAIHNWGYSIIFITVGLAWYQKSLVARCIALIQASLTPILASGSFNPFVIVVLAFIFLAVFGITVLIERKQKEYFFQQRLQKRTWEWINLHLLIICWLLIIHIGFVFLVVRAPTEIDLLQISFSAGWLKNYTPELHEISTWAFDLAFIGWGVVVLYEQFKMGYNFKNNPWPRWSFYVIFIAIAAGLLGLLIQLLTFGFNIQNILDLIT